MKPRKSIVTLVLFLLSGQWLFAQNGQPKTEMADLMRSNGRIYVVLAVVLTILIGIILYLYRIEKKISHLEKEK